MPPVHLRRVALGAWPTPLQSAPRLAEALGRALYVKRDDLSGIGGGGNKVRKLEFQLARALEERSTHVITCGAMQSNHAHLTAAAARRCGLQPVLVLARGEDGSRLLGGNLLLDRLMDAEVHAITPPSGQSRLEALNRGMEEVAEAIAHRGGRPYIVPEGGTDALGSVGYALAVEELRDQLAALPGPPRRPLLVLATGTCGTHAGLLAGARRIGVGLDVLGMSISGDTAVKREKTAKLATETLALLGHPGGVLAEEVRIDDGAKGPGYAVPTAECRKAIRLAARTEGLFLDPVYTGKALAGLLRLAGAGRLAPHDAVIFLHTGGFPLLFVPDMEVL